MQARITPVMLPTVPRGDIHGISSVNLKYFHNYSLKAQAWSVLTNYRHAVNHLRTAFDGFNVILSREEINISLKQSNLSFCRDENRCAEVDGH
jgi:hypothetical protein